MQRRSQSDLESNTQSKQAIQRNHAIGKFVHAIDAIDISLIFTLFLKEYWHTFLEKTGKYFLFPIAAIASCFQAILAWRLVTLEDRVKSGSIVRALVETVSALCIATAVVGGLLEAEIFALASPIIFTLVMASKTLFQGGSSVFNWGKTDREPNLEDKERFAQRAKDNAVGALVGVMATIAIAAVMILGLHQFAVLGIGSGVIGASYAVHRLCQADRSHTIIENVPPAAESSIELAEQSSESSLTNNAALFKAFGITAAGNSSPSDRAPNPETISEAAVPPAPLAPAPVDYDALKIALAP